MKVREETKEQRYLSGSFVKREKKRHKKRERGNTK
jgi:hypothetical protein